VLAGEHVGGVDAPVVGERAARRLGHRPAATATLARARVFDELALPITTMASASTAIACNAACRLVVAKQRSPRAAVQRSGNCSRARSMIPSQSCIERVVCASSATFEGSSTVEITCSRSPSSSTSRMAPGATASVPDASSWPR
jgi:hypothetical protein